MALLIFGIVITVVSVIFLVRGTLVMLGYWKEPIIRTFSEYGPREMMYMPAQQILLWASALSICTGMWAYQYPGLSTTLTTLGILMALVVGLGYSYREQAEQIHLKLFRYPVWYHELRERTTRYERRRIGYMWLSMPMRARLSYNSSDTMFLVWADFIIMGTIREEEWNPRDEEHFYTGH